MNWNLSGFACIKLSSNHLIAILQAILRFDNITSLLVWIVQIVVIFVLIESLWASLFAQNTLDSLWTFHTRLNLMCTNIWIHQVATFSIRYCLRVRLRVLLKHMWFRAKTLLESWVPGATDHKWWRYSFICQSVRHSKTVLVLCSRQNGIFTYLPYALVWISEVSTDCKEIVCPICTKVVCSKWTILHLYRHGCLNGCIIVLFVRLQGARICAWQNSLSWLLKLSLMLVFIPRVV